MVIGVLAGIRDDVPDGREQEFFIAENEQLFFRLGQLALKSDARNGKLRVDLGHLPGSLREYLVDADQIDLQTRGGARRAGKPQQRLGQLAQLPGILVNGLDHLPVFFGSPARCRATSNWLEIEVSGVDSSCEALAMNRPCISKLSWSRLSSWLRVSER